MKPSPQTLVGRDRIRLLSPFDPIAYLWIAGILLASSLAATLVPAVRATRVEPAITLRGE